MFDKTKKVGIQITFPIKEAEQLTAVVDAFNKEGIYATKSLVLLNAFRDYIKMLILSDITGKDGKKDA